MSETTATNPLIEGLFDSLPAEGSCWPSEDREAWLTLAGQVFDYLYRSLKCEGCGKTKREVTHLVRFDSGLCLCGECVDVSVEIISKEKAQESVTSGDVQEVTTPVSSL